MRKNKIISYLISFVFLFIFSLNHSLAADVELLITYTSINEEPIGTDDITLNGGFFENNGLTLEVSHLGGCTSHHYQLNWDGKFSEQSPQQVNFYLSHDSNNDPCDDQVINQLYFDLSEISDNFSNNIIHVNTANTSMVVYIPNPF